MAAQAPTRTLRVFQVEQGIGEPEEALRARACAVAGIAPELLRGFRYARRSLDARRRAGKQRLAFVVNADLVVDADLATPGLARALRAGRVKEPLPPEAIERSQRHPSLSEAALSAPVLVVGAGPAGLFAALVLARNGVAVTLIDRGRRLEGRARPLALFRRTRRLDPEANLLFGEGGAGTYSDGKIYTRVDDPLEVPLLEELVACGAPPEITFDSLAHIGTDRLHRILPVFRRRLEGLGVRFAYDTRLEELTLTAEQPRRVLAARTSAGEMPCSALVLAPGHSARDTWRRLAESGLAMEAKPFQLGLRVEHPQELIDRGRYGGAPGAESLGAASYGLVCKAGDGLPPAHSFCMCPGGRIVASVNEPGHLCTNGCSNSRHSSRWASAAIVTTFEPSDFGADAFAGVRFQAELERRFFAAGGGDFTAPAQRLEDFVAGRESRSLPRSSYALGIVPGRLDRLLPPRAAAALARAVRHFGRRIEGFAGPEGLFVGLESRSSGPLRVPRGRDDRRALGFSNLYPVGEGAGYAGGIMSAALDGARAAVALLRDGLLL